MLTENFAVRCHELNKPLFPHAGNGSVPVASLVIERQGSMLYGIGLQEAIEAGPFSCLPKERQEHVRKGRYEQESVASGSVANMRGGEIHAKMNVLDVAERLLDTEAASVELDHLLAVRSARLVARHQDSFIRLS